MATLEILEERKKMSPRKAAIADMRACGLDVTVLELRKTVIVEEVEEFVFRSLDDGRILNGGKRVQSFQKLHSYERIRTKSRRIRRSSHH